MTNHIKPVNDRWFYRLKDDGQGKSNCLFGSIPRHMAYTNFIVYRIEDNGFRKYAAFRSPVEFFYFYRRQPKPREYHEVILGEKEQRPRFDLDISYDNYSKAIPLRGLVIREAKEISVEWMVRMGNRIVGKIIDGIKVVMGNFGLKFNVEKDVLFYNSHLLEELPYKFSAHIILTNHSHFNYEEAKEFYRMVSETDIALHIAEKDGIVDASIYSSLKSFRLLGSTKDGKREKVVAPLPYNGQIYEPKEPSTTKEEIIQFRQSCITDTNSTTHIPIILPDKKIYDSKVKLPDSIEEIIIPHIGEDFVVEEVKGGLILLKRLRPSYCNLCHREHHNDNPYLTVRENGDVYFHCRRATNDNGKYQICHIDGIVVNKDSSSNYSVETEDNSIESTPVIVKPNIKREGINFSLLETISENHNHSKPPQKKKKKLRMTKLDKIYGNWAKDASMTLSKDFFDHDNQ